MKTLTALAVALLAVTPLAAATPPNVINYQGVLRDAGGNPATGSFEMVFRLYDQATGGTLILTDYHAPSAGGPAVDVTNGLFSVEIGSGLMTSSYPTLSAAFGAQGSIWLEIQVNAETLTPRLHFASAGYALNAGTLEGIAASGFVNTSGQSQTKSGILLVGTAPGGPFASLADTGYGVIAKGSTAAGDFRESDTTAKAELAKDGVGVTASGPTYGAYFGKADLSAYAYLGQAATGINAYGSSRGVLGSTIEPLLPGADTEGGYFAVRDWSGVLLADAYLAEASTSAAGYRLTKAGSFQNWESGAHVSLAEGGTSDEGVWAESGSRYGWGGVFISGTWFALCCGGGVAGLGEARGGYFVDLDSSGYAQVGYDTYKIYGSGSVAFAQNHPSEADQVVVYNAPEGDEVATYTRGSARLVGGEVRIPLGETFAWVTNPDVGLTAYVTPVGESADLYVVSKTTKELVVRSRDPHPDPVEFDYIVYGLRIGFEETSIVQRKGQEAFIPSMAGHRALYADHPELRRFNALERMKQEHRRMGLEATSDLRASAALREAIHEYDHETDKERLAAANARFGPVRRATPGGGAEPGPRGIARAFDAAQPQASPPNPRTGGSREVGGESVANRDRGDAPRAALAPVETLRVSEPVRAGELLAIDPLSPESVRRAEGVGDPRFVGVAAQDSADDQVVLATTRIVRVQADATFGAIAPGDLLTTSPSAGLAMRAADAAPGAVFGKALDPLEGGTGEIRVLWMPQ